MLFCRHIVAADFNDVQLKYVVVDSNDFHGRGQSHAGIWMLVIGLTGGIASGKTTVSRMVAQAGCSVICADELARLVVEPGSSALEEIRRVFGPDVLDAGGRLDRGRMAALVFNDPNKRKWLESIIHPRVEEEKNKRLAALRDAGHTLAVVDVPLLFEKSWEKYFDLVILAYVPREIQIQRLMLRDNLSFEEVQARLNAQIPIDEKKKKAAYVIDNSGTFEDTEQQVQAILKELEAGASKKKISS